MMTPERPSDAVRVRLMAAAAAEPASRPGTWRRRAIIFGMLSVGWMIATSITMGIRPDWRELPPGALPATLIALLGIAALASFASVARGRAMVGATTETLLATAWGLPLVLLAIVVAIDPRGPSTKTFSGGVDTFSHGMGCDLLVLTVASPLIGFGLAASRGLTRGRPLLTGACLGLAAATWAHAVVRLHCPVGGTGHAFAGHLLPALPLMAAAAWGMWTISRRGYPRAKVGRRRT